jgi:pimeloyl-ACP methyl ester carboxylesterase
VATGAGLGLGPRHLQKTGVGIVALVGLALLVLGVVLLGSAMRRGWRALHHWSRLWLLPGAAVVLVVVASVALAFLYAVTPRPSLGSATPLSIGSAYRTVSYSTTDGQLQSAWYIPSRTGAAVVMRHGAGSTRTATLPQAAVLARHGYGVLLTDARGHGRSQGRGMDLGWYGELDISAAVSFLQRQPDVDQQRIGVVGLSMGGEEAIGAAAADQRIRAVVAEGVTGRTAADKARWLPEGLSGTVQRGIDRLTYALTDLLTPASPPRALHRAIAVADSTPFLLITAGRLPDETRAADHLRAAAPGRVQVRRIDGASHTGGLRKDPRGWENAVIAFLDRELAP